MNKIAIELVRVFIAAGIVAGAVTIFFKMGTGEEPPRRNLEGDPAQVVKTALVKPHNGDLTLDVDGVAAPYREIPIAAEVAARIVEKSEICRAGKFVRQGELLVVLDDRDYKLEVNRLRKEIEQAQSNLRELDVDRENIEKLVSLAEEDLEIQRREVARVKDLASRRAASVAEVDQAQRARIAIQNGLTQLQNQIRLKLAQKVRLEAAAALRAVQLERAELDLKRTQVTAPISGIVVSAPAEKDAYVQKGAPLLTVEDTSRVEIRCQLHMEELYWLWGQTNRNTSASLEAASRASQHDYEIPRARVTVIYELADQQFLWRGELSRFEGIGLDERTRTMPCRVLVHDPTAVESISSVSTTRPPALLRGMFVKMQIHVPSDELLLQVPEYAIRPGDLVWVYENGKLQIVPVSIVRIADEVALVRKSDRLKAGARVITSPIVAPRTGMAVRDIEIEGADQSKDDTNDADAPVSDASVSEAPVSDATVPDGSDPNVPDPNVPDPAPCAASHAFGSQANHSRGPSR